MIEERLRSDLRAAALLAHADYELLEAYVDGRAPAVDREIVEVHVEDCPTCAAELNDLRSFAARRKPRPIALWVAAACAALLIGGALVVWRAGKPPRPAPIAVTDPAEVLLREVPPRWSAAARAALRGGALAAPAVLHDVAPSDVTLRGTSSPLPTPLRAPVGVVVQTDSPAFEWSAASNDAEYAVAVFAPHAKLVAESPRLKTTTWTPPHPLPRGTTYIWQLTVFRNGSETTFPRPPQSEARFAIVDAGTAAEIEEARRSGSRLAAALAFARAGMKKEAESEFAALAAKYPRNTAVQGLLDSVRRW